jgi:hypothetical protein
MGRRAWGSTKRSYSLFRRVQGVYHTQKGALRQIRIRRFLGVLCQLARDVFSGYQESRESSVTWFPSLTRSLRL